MNHVFCIACLVAQFAMMIDAMGRRVLLKNGVVHGLLFLIVWLIDHWAPSTVLEKREPSLTSWLRLTKNNNGDYLSLSSEALTLLVHKHLFEHLDFTAVLEVLSRNTENQLIRRHDPAVPWPLHSLYWLIPRDEPHFILLRSFFSSAPEHFERLESLFLVVLCAVWRRFQWQGGKIPRICHPPPRGKHLW